MEQILEKLFNQNHIIDFFKNLITFFIIFIILYFIRIGILKYLNNRVHGNIQIRVYKIYINYIFYAFILLFIFLSFLPSVEKVVTVLSLFGAGILLILKEIILNFFGFFYIIIRKPFHIGDRIKLLNIYGDVLDIRIQDFSVLQLYPVTLGGQSTGRVVHIPNSVVFLNPVSNFSKEFAFNWLEIKVPLTMHSNWQLAEQIIQEIIQEIVKPLSPDDEKLQISKKEYAIEYHKLAPKTFLEFQNGCVIISIRILCIPKEQRQVKDFFWRKFLKRIETQKEIFINESYSYNQDF